MNARVALISAFVAALIGAIIWAFVAQNRWEHRCHEAGGRVEQRLDGYVTTPHYIYDTKGNITSIYFTDDPQHSYHCWVRGQEVKP